MLKYKSNKLIASTKFMCGSFGETTLAFLASHNFNKFFQTSTTMDMYMPKAKDPMVKNPIFESSQPSVEWLVG